MMSAKNAENTFGIIEKHGRKVVVVLATEEYDRLKALKQRAVSRSKRKS
jgi:hypothetical protein